MSADRFHAVEMEAEGHEHRGGAAVGLNDGDDLGFHPPSEAVESEVMAVFHATAQIAEEAQSEFGTVPDAEEVAQVE
jgi:hypothetical protein